MNAVADRSIRIGRSGDLAFVIVVVTAYISALGSSSRSFTQLEVFVLLAAGLVYTIAGIYGSACCERSDLIFLRAAYFAIEIPLAAAIVYVAHGSGFVVLIALPLAAQSVLLLPRWGMILVCGALYAVFAILFGLLAGWQAGLESSLTVLSGIIFVVVFTQVAVSEQKARKEVEQLAAELGEANRKLREHAVQVEELATAKERNRLAREIHDGLAHYLTAVNMQIQAARAVLESDRPRALDALGKAQMLAQEALADVRRSVAALRASPTESRSFSETLSGLAQECRAAGVVAELATVGRPRTLPPQAELTLYRAAQEALTNVRKHARAARVDVTLDYSDDMKVRLSVRDDGLGASPSLGRTGGGFGLLGLRERVQLLGGEVEISTAQGQGFALEVVVPG